MMRRRGIGMIVALTVITLVGATTALLTLQVGRMVQQRKQDRARSFAQLVLASGLAYVEVHAQTLCEQPLAEPLSLPTEGLVPAEATPELKLSKTEAGHIAVEVVVTLGRARATEREVLSVGSAARPPASAPAPATPPPAP
ncbi:MAG: hypothetical protein JXA69_19270 [Phycisphaerae bacterium]|nr:hypothetical protein [Phycisphaerae bacterium]